MKTLSQLAAEIYEANKPYMTWAEAKAEAQFWFDYIQSNKCSK